MVEPPDERGLPDNRTPPPSSSARRAPTVSTPADRPSSEATPEDKSVYLRQEGKVYLVHDWATLQRWIMERRVGRDDEVSEGGVHWDTVGGRPELGSFFTAVEQLEAAELAGIDDVPTPIRSDRRPVGATGLSRLDDDTEGVPIGLPPLPTEDVVDGPETHGDDYPHAPPSRLTPSPADHDPGEQASVPDFSSAPPDTPSQAGPEPHGQAPEADPAALRAAAERDPTRPPDPLLPHTEAVGDEPEPPSSANSEPPPPVDEPQGSVVGDEMSADLGADLLREDEQPLLSVDGAPPTPAQGRGGPDQDASEPSSDDGFGDDLMLEADVGPGAPNLGRSDEPERAAATFGAETSSDDDSDPFSRLDTGDPFRDFESEPVEPTRAQPAASGAPKWLWLAVLVVFLILVAVLGWGVGTGRVDFSSARPQDPSIGDARPNITPPVAPAPPPVDAPLDTDTDAQDTDTDAQDTDTDAQDTDTDVDDTTAPGDTDAAQAEAQPTQPASPEAPDDAPAARPRVAGARQLKERGWSAINQEQFSEAVQSFATATERAPSDPQAHFGLGYSLLGLGRAEQARQSLCKALTLNPGALGAEIEATLRRGELTCP